MLDEEQSTDDNLRQQFKERWSRLSSEKLTTPLYDEVHNYRDILSKAQYADGIVKQKFENHRKCINLLSKTEVKIRKPD